jgi:toxin ParE1/3/4
MKVVYTEDALRDLDEILTYIGANYPAMASAFVGRLRMIERRIGRWPESAEEVEQRPGVRMAPLL